MASPVVVSRIQNRRGLQAQFEALYPVGYDGIGGYNPPGSGPIGFTPVAYPDVLLPGELAFCTDSRRLFIGNINGEYTELGTDVAGIILPPLVLDLAPVGVFTATGIQYTATPFFTLLYDLTDNLNPDWNTPGIDFARNGSLQITALGFPDATLTDSGTEINNALPSTISFIAEYNVDTVSIDIKYMHDFPGNLFFSTSNIIWQSF